MPAHTEKKRCLGPKRQTDRQCRENMLTEMGNTLVDSQKKKIALVTTQPSNSTPWTVVQRTGNMF